jgi:uncharacterized protein with beta-barrel porin domain
MRTKRIWTTPIGLFSLAGLLVTSSSPAFSACTPAAANDVVAVCMGTTINQSGGAPGTSTGTTGYGTSVETDVSVIIEPSATLTGTDFGIWHTSIDRVHNDGTIQAGNQAGVYALDLNEVKNTGTISSISWVGVGALAPIKTITNSGSISGRDAAVANVLKLVNLGTLKGNSGVIGAVDIVNKGLILGNFWGVGASVTNLVNHGTIKGVQNSGVLEIKKLTNLGTISGGTIGVSVPTGNTLYNFGIIEGGVHGVIAGLDLSHLNNAGTIVGGTNGVNALGIASLTNSGTIVGNSGIAIDEQGSFLDSTLTLLAGSNIQGTIDLGGGVNTLNVGPGLSMVTTFDTTISPITIGHMSGQPYAVQVNGNNTTVAVIDTNATGAQHFDAQLADLSDGISGAVGSRMGRENSNGDALTAFQSNDYGALGFANYDDPDELKEALRRQRARQMWVEAFGTYRNQGNDNPRTDTEQVSGGLVAGIDGALSDSLTLGLFAGGSAGQIENDLGTQKTDSTSFFGGTYASLENGKTTWDFITTIGMTRYDQERQVANNLVVGGVQTAASEYDGIFVIPELTITQEIQSPTPELGQTIEPFVTLRYAGLFLDGFTETGVPAPLTLDDREVHQGTVRAGIRFPRSWDTGNGIMTARATFGLEGRSTFGEDTLTGSLLGQGITFSPNDNDGVLAGFAGFNAELLTRSGITAYAAIETKVETESAIQLSAKGGIRVPF